MRIINPLYDQAFKYMMDNELIAKKVLSVILEKDVISVQSRASELAMIDKRREIPLSRFDFKAIIRTPENTAQNVLIEVQKSKNPDPIMRFRRYLGKNYLHKEVFINQDGKEEKRSIPIITIYILGYNLPDYNMPAILVNNCVIDAVTKQQIDKKDDFVQLLTHPSYILQIRRLREERRTKLEKFLSFFDQNQRTDDDFILDINEQEIDPEFREIAKHLNLASQDEEIIDKLLAEEDYDSAFDKLENDLEEAQKREEEERKQKEEAQKREEEAQKQKEEAQKQKERLALELARVLKSVNTPISDIVQKTGLPAEVIEKL
jgi:hypothetical protein